MIGDFKVRVIAILKRYIKNPKRIVGALGAHGFFNWLPDKPYLKLVYMTETGKKLNLENPKTFNEKLQWLKLNYRKPEYSIYVDKYAVRSYIAKTIGEKYLIPLIGVYNNVEEIDWESLPGQFVLKCTHGYGSNIICLDKSKLDINFAKKTLIKWTKKNWYWFGREWPYKHVKPRIICEKLMADELGKELIDYKIMCFNGKAKCIFVCLNRHSKTGLNIDIYDLDWKLMEFGRPNHPNSGMIIPKPENFDKMIYYSEIISKDIPFLRVDFYEVKGQLYFGELTLYPGAGFEKFIPEEYDNLLGSWLELPIGKP